MKKVTEYIKAKYGKDADERNAELLTSKDLPHLW